MRAENDLNESSLVTKNNYKMRGDFWQIVVTKQNLVCVGMVKETVIQSGFIFRWQKHQDENIKK